MKLAEFDYADWTMLGISRLLGFLNDIVESHKGQPVRVEIHSLDDPPWPTERPRQWGVGHWCEVQRSPGKSFRGICVVDDSDEWATVVVPEEASVWEFPVDQITSYGPRAEVGT